MRSGDKHTLQSGQKTQLTAIANNHKHFKDFEFVHEKDRKEGIRKLLNIAFKYIGLPETKGSSAL